MDAYHLISTSKELRTALRCKHMTKLILKSCLSEPVSPDHSISILYQGPIRKQTPC